ncbi:hypothetical protein P692DRAFT_20760264, partial [Suillus brevipes Sb2]
GTRGPGAALEELCRMTNDELESLPDIQPFTVPMLGKLAFSFASLQSSVDRYISLMEDSLPSSHKITLARAFQTAAARQLCAKLTLSLQKLELKALDEYGSNERISLHFPPLDLCTGQRFNMPIDSQSLKFNTDNPAMIACKSVSPLKLHERYMNKTNYLQRSKHHKIVHISIDGMAGYRRYIISLTCI